ncbi:MAG: NUDIX hydrolase [Thermoanaerobacterium sp.]|nr:NUDIX hydrolase [Thermoanaerobacterium sp.]
MIKLKIHCLAKFIFFKIIIRGVVIMYPNYRISVEIILLHERKVLLTKRAGHCKVAPNVWNVPAGKVKYDEIPTQGLYREAKEEINLDVELLEELSVRNIKSKSGDEDIYCVVFTSC